MAPAAISLTHLFDNETSTASTGESSIAESLWFPIVVVLGALLVLLGVLVISVPFACLVSCLDGDCRPKSPSGNASQPPESDIYTTRHQNRQRENDALPRVSEDGLRPTPDAYGAASSLPSYDEVANQRMETSVHIIVAQPQPAKLAEDSRWITKPGDP
jgi:hypothetical protein